MSSPHRFFNLTIRPENTEPEVWFQAHYIPATWGKTTVKAFNLSPLIRPRHMRAQSLGQAIGGCDLYVKYRVVNRPMFRGFVVLEFSSPLILTVENWIQ